MLSEETRAAITAYVKVQVAKAPPLTAGQRARVAAILHRVDARMASGQVAA